VKVEVGDEDEVIAGVGAVGEDLGEVEELGEVVEAFF